MRHHIVFVAGLLLIGNTAGDEARAQKGPPEDVCTKFGNKFCTGATCNVSVDVGDTFTCKCEGDNMYFDASEEICTYKKSCDTMECAIGHCKGYPGHAACVCENKYDLALNCKVYQHVQKECQQKGGTAVVDMDRIGGARCDCGQWAVMDRERKKCVATTCLHPGLSCKDLCEKNLLDKDPRCCEGWDPSDCSKAPKEESFCSPGTIRKDGACENVCDAGEAKLLCKDGCRKVKGSGMAYECRCDPGYVTAEDGIQCKVDYKSRECTVEQKQKCLPGQECFVKDGAPTCECPEDQQLRDGACTGECFEKNCHEFFTDCQIYSGKEDCACTWSGRKDTKRPLGMECILEEYYYTVSFKPNFPLNPEDGSANEKRVLHAMRTTIGKDVFMVEILNFTDVITARLLTNKPLSPYLLKKLQTCEHPDGNTCILYPKLPIEKGSSTEIKEENLCHSLLKAQESATKDTNECVKEGNYFWFKCKPGFREVELKTKGRLRRSVCQPAVSCGEKEEKECEKKGAICVIENTGGVCKCPPHMIEDQGLCTPPKECNHGEKQECTKRGRECAYSDGKAVCKCPDGTVENGDECIAEKAPTACTEEETRDCESNSQECVVENEEAVCKEKADLTTTTQVPVGPAGSGSGTISVSAVLLLSTLMAALPA